MDVYLNDPQHLHERLMAVFGAEALQTIAAIVAWAHVRSYGIGSEMYGLVGQERSGLLRWIQCDADLLRLKGRFPNVSIKWTGHAGGAGKHVEIAADDVRLLISHDQDSDAYAVGSNYANTLVESNQMVLFQTEARPENSGEERYYTFVLFHSKADAKGMPPKALDVRFPDGRGEYAADKLDLLQLFPNLLNEAWLQMKSLEWAALPLAMEEKVADAAMPSVREAKQKRAGS